MEKAVRMVDFPKSREQVFKFVNHRIIVGGIVAGNAENLGMLLALFKYVNECSHYLTGRIPPRYLRTQQQG